MQHFHVIACHVLWRELCYFAALSPNSCTFDFLRQGLHNTPEILRKELQAAIDRTTPPCDAILIGYGLCSNGLEGITARNIPLVAVRAHDCITFLLGSKERYRAYFDAHPGTYWYSPGWIESSSMPGPERVSHLLAEYTEKYGADNAQYLMQMEQAWMNEYSNAAYIDLGFGDNERFRAYTRDCAQWLGWHFDELTGDPSLIQRLFSGQWNSSDFLIVPPGHVIAASHDDTILCARPAPAATEHRS